MEIAILQKNHSENLEDFEFKINRKTTQIKKDNCVVNVEIKNYEKTLICIITYKQK